MMWVLSVPVWVVAAISLIVAVYGFGRTLAIASSGTRDEVSAHAFASSAFAIASSVLSALAVLIARL